MNNFYIGSRSYTIPEEFYVHPTPNFSFYVKLTHLGLIHINGEQAETFLQGQLTNNLSQSSDTKIQKQLLCNIKGQLISKLHLIKKENSYLLICPQDLIPNVLSLLHKTALLSRVTLEADTNPSIYGIISSEKNLPKEFISLEDNNYISFTAPNLPEKEEIFWHYHQLKNNHFSIYPETSKLFLPHQLQLESNGWINFNKGCYRGQEIIARMHYRGKIKYQLQQLIQNQDPFLQPGSNIVNTQQEKIGEIVDLCPINPKQLLIIACMKIA